jgi:cyanate permease
VLQPVGMKSLFAPSLISITVLLSIAYFGTVGTYYYFVKWMPTIIADLGYSISEATRVLGFVSLGGVVGSVGVGLLIRVASIRPVLIVCLVSAAISIVGFPYFTDTLESMRYVGFLAGIFIFAALSGYFGLFAVSFPSSLLGSGSGLVLAIGRGGAVLGPLIPGFLFTAGFTIKTVALIMTSGVICAAFAVALLRSQSSAFAGAQLAD